MSATDLLPIGCTLTHALLILEACARRQQAATSELRDIGSDAPAGASMDPNFYCASLAQQAAVQITKEVRMAIVARFTVGP